MNCTNCSAAISGKFCANCGQKTSTARLSIHEFVHDGWHVLTHTDKGIFRVIKDLLLHPALFYKQYFGGQRKKYFSPILFFIITAGLVALLYGYVFAFQDKILNTNNEFGKMIFHDTKFRALLILPIQILLTWLIFRKRYNLAEVAVFWLFTLGLGYCLRISIIPLYFPLIEHKDTIDRILFYLSFVIILWQGVALFGRNLLSIIALFLIINISMVLDSVAVLYILFGTDIFHSPLPIHNWWDLIKASY